MAAALPRALLVGFVGSASVASAAARMDNQQCGVTCQRFGMQSLGPEFKDITDPTACVKKCAEVYPPEHPAALVQVAAARMDNQQCGVTCQRFGMKSLGKEFQDITDPTACVKKCAEVYPPQAALVQVAAARMDNQQCGVTCQRFGMKSLGKEFQDITDPTACVKKCAEVYPPQAALLQVAAARMDNQQCGVTCQRFGMKSLGKEFQDIMDPTACVKKCAEVYPPQAALVQVAAVAKMDNQQCGVTCQRFGMKSLGPAFQDITDPTACVKKCDEVYPKAAASFLAKPTRALRAEA